MLKFPYIFTFYSFKGEAEHVLRGAGAYNLACVEAADGNAVKAIEYLRDSSATGERLSRKRITQDPDPRRSCFC